MNENEEGEVTMTEELDGLLGKLNPIIREWMDKEGTISAKSLGWLIHGTVENTKFIKLLFTENTELKRRLDQIWKEKI